MYRKICPKCGKLLDASMFYKDKSKPDGLTSTCKLCRRKRQKEYREENVIKVNEYEKKRRKLESRKKYSNEYQKKYRKVNHI